MRIKQLWGREHLVLPVRLDVPGVVRGAFRDRKDTAAMFSASELKKSADRWNGMPIVTRHSDGKSARTPEFIGKFSVGEVYNVRVAKDGALDGEAWLDRAKLKERAPGVLERIERGDEVQVSTSNMCGTKDKTGVFNGANYSRVVFDLRPDHLAIGVLGLNRGCKILNQGDEMSDEFDDDDLLTANDRADDLDEYFDGLFGGRGTAHIVTNEGFDSSSDALLIPASIDWKEERRLERNAKKQKCAKCSDDEPDSDDMDAEEVANENARRMGLAGDNSERRGSGAVQAGVTNESMIPPSIDWARGGQIITNGAMS